MADLINIGICLSDIPKDKIKRAENGKCYVNLCVAERKEADMYGNTHAVYVRQSKEEREAKANRTYVGSGNPVIFHPANSPETIEQLPPAQEVDDLPF